MDLVFPIGGVLCSWLGSWIIVSWRQSADCTLPSKPLSYLRSAAYSYCVKYAKESLRCHYKELHISQTFAVCRYIVSDWLEMYMTANYRVLLRSHFMLRLVFGVSWPVEWCQWNYVAKKYFSWVPWPTESISKLCTVLHLHQRLILEHIYPCLTLSDSMSLALA